MSEKKCSYNRPNVPLVSLLPVPCKLTFLLSGNVLRVIYRIVLAGSLWSKPNKAKLISSTFEIGYFRVSPGLCIKTRLSAQPLIWKCFSILMQIKLIFTTTVVHLASFWKWGFLEPGSALLHTSISGKALNALKSVMVLPLPGGPQRTMGLCSASHVYKSASCRTVSTVGTTTSGAATLWVSTSIWGTLDCHSTHSPWIVTWKQKINLLTSITLRASLKNTVKLRNMSQRRKLTLSVLFSTKSKVFAVVMSAQ